MGRHRQQNAEHLLRGTHGPFYVHHQPQLKHPQHHPLQVQHPAVPTASNLLSGSDDIIATLPIRHQNVAIMSPEPGCRCGISVARSKISDAIMVQGSLIGRAKAEAASQRPSRCTVQAETDCGQAKIPCSSQTSSASAQGGPKTKANIKVHHFKDKHR